MATLVMQVGEWLAISAQDSQWSDVRRRTASADRARAVSLAALPTPSDASILVEALGAGYVRVEVADAAKSDAGWRAALTRLGGQARADAWARARFGTDSPAYQIQLALAPGEPWLARRAAEAAYRSLYPAPAGYSYGAQAAALGAD